MVAHELVFFVCGRGGIARSVLSRKGSCIPGRLFAGLHASPPGKHLMDSDLVPCQRVLAPVAGRCPGVLLASWYRRGGEQAAHAGPP